VDEYHLTQEEISVRVGKSRTAIANALRLLGLSAEIQQSLANGEISEGHARALLSIADPEQRRLAWRRVIAEGLTVRQTEALTRAWKPAAEPAPEPKRLPQPMELRAVEERLRGALGTKVQVVKGRRGGRVVIHFYNDEELEALVERFSGDG
jgi:ParB family chromosome partitioning protein